MSGIEDLEKKIAVVKAHPRWHCRFHPTDSFHEVGCPHMKWTAEQLQGALETSNAVVRVYQNELWGFPLDDSIASTYIVSDSPVGEGKQLHFTRP